MNVETGKIIPGDEYDRMEERQRRNYAKVPQRFGQAAEARRQTNTSAFVGHDGLSAWALKQKEKNRKARKAAKKTKQAQRRRAR